MGQSLQRAVPPGLLPVLTESGHDEEEDYSSPHQVVVNTYLNPVSGHAGQEDETAVKDLDHLPPELAITILSHLDATDLCLAACVWQELATDNILWHGLCR